MNVYSELFQAQLENLSSTPNAALAGRIWYRSDINAGTAQIATGSLVKQILLNDQKIVVGTNGTAATNARLYRSGTGELSLVLGSDTTAEGTRAPASFATLGFVPLTDTYSNLAALTRKSGALYYASDSKVPYVDNGTLTLALNPDPTNYVINGNFDMWQRGVSVTAIAAGSTTFVADRFSFNSSSTAAIVTVKQTADVPTLAQSGFASTYCLHVDVTTADASLGANDRAVLQTKFEGNTWAQLKNKICTLSFWVKSTKTGIFSVAFQTGSTFGASTYVAEYTVSVTDTWEKKVITADMSSPESAPSYTSAGGLCIVWALMAGSTQTQAAGSWVDAVGFYGSPNQVNAMDSTSNDFKLSQVMLNVGGYAGRFVRSGVVIGREIQLCQRYYEKSYDLATDPATAVDGGSVSSRSSSAYTVSVGFAVRKRTAPTVTLYNPVTGTGDQLRDVGAGSNVAASATFIGESAFRVSVAVTDGNLGYFHWIANAEI